MSGIDFSQFTTKAAFAEKVETAVTNVDNWIKAAEVKPAYSYGNVRLYLVSDLTDAMEKHSRGAQGFRALGYVHPDKHKQLQDLHASAVQEAITYSEALKAMEESYAALQLENAQLTERFNQVRASHDDLADQLHEYHKADEAELIALEADSE